MFAEERKEYERQGRKTNCRLAPENGKDSRSSNTLIANLCNRQITCETLDFSRAERKIYDAIYDRSRRKFIQLDQEGTIKNSYTSILAMLMRWVPTGRDLGKRFS